MVSQSCPGGKVVEVDIKVARLSQIQILRDIKEYLNLGAYKDKITW